MPKNTVTKDTVMKAIMDKYGNDVVKEMLGLKLDGSLCMNDIIEATDGWDDDMLAVIQSMPFNDLLDLGKKAKRGPAKKPADKKAATKKPAAKKAKSNGEAKDNGEPTKDTTQKFDIGPAEVQEYLRNQAIDEASALAAKDIAKDLSQGFEIKDADDATAFFRRIRHVLGGLNKNDMVGVVGSGKGTKYYHKAQESADPEPVQVAE